jgi:DNA polymerase elongation subunit (family B)
MAKILILDIETAPNQAFVWGAWKNNIGVNQWIAKGYIMSYSGKWLDKDEIIYEENRTTNDRRITSKLFRLLSEADIVVAHNGDGFDLPTILGRGLVHGLTPPAPYLTVDTCRVARRRFRFTQNSLANLAEELGCAHKEKHKKFPGFELWTECMAGNAAAWDEMRVYNIADVTVLEEVYLKMRPYINDHPNVVHHVAEKGNVHCPKCGSTNIHWRGYWYSKMGMCYRRFVCLDCGGWGKARFAEKDLPGNNGRNAV